MYPLMFLLYLRAHRRAERAARAANERGQTTVEWMVIAFFAVVSIAIVGALLTGLGEDVMQSIRDTMGL